MSLRLDAEIVVGTYRYPERLRLVLRGLTLQTDREFRTVIADDGSGPEIASVISQFANEGLRLRHVWHEDIGFRKTRILNEAVKTSSADYLLFIDADCIPEPGYVRDHKAFARDGQFVAGARVWIGKEVTRKLVEEKIPLETIFDRGRLVRWFLAGKAKSVTYGMRLPWPLVNARRVSHRTLIGCNMGIWRQDLVEINGFDSDMIGPGIAEDTDVEWRLKAIGRTEVTMLGRGAVFHLHHGKTHQDGTNAAIMRRKQMRNEIRAASGIVATDRIGNPVASPPSAHL